MPSKPVKFLRKLLALHREQGLTGYLALGFRDGGPGGPFKEKYVSLTATDDTLEDVLDRYSDESHDQYFCPHPFNTKKRRKEFSTDTSVLWADLDKAHPRDCKPPPQLAWESSPGRYACMWKVDGTMDPKDAEGINHALTYANKADVSGWDLTQYLRIPGTRNHKYADAPRGKLLWDEAHVYGLGDLPDPIAAEEGGEGKLNGKSIDLPGLFEKYRAQIPRKTLRDLTCDPRDVTVGSRSEVLWRIENELITAKVPRDVAYQFIKNSAWNKFRGRRNEDEQLRRELEKVAGDGRMMIHELEKTGDNLRSVQASKVKEEAIHWLWFPYIARGKVTMLEGDPGLGKSYVALGFMAAFSNGLPLLGQIGVQTKAKCCYFTAEDGPADTLKPRLMTMKSDLNNVYFHDRAISLDEEGIKEIRREIEKNNLRFIVIDPFVAYMGGSVDMHKANETREVMTRLSDLATETGCAIMLIRHLTKGGEGKKALYRGLGSIDITGAARSVLMVGRHPENPKEARVVMQIKNNIGPKGKPVGYLLRGAAQIPFKWLGEVKYTADEVLKAEENAEDTPHEMATAFLQEVLADGPRLRDEVIAEAEAKSISPEVLLDVRQDLRLLVSHSASRRLLWSLR